MDFIRSHWKYPEKDIATTFMDINLKDDNGEEVSCRQRIEYANYLTDHYKI